MESLEPLACPAENALRAEMRRQSFELRLRATAYIIPDKDPTTRVIAGSFLPFLTLQANVKPKLPNSIIDYLPPHRSIQSRGRATKATRALSTYMEKNRGY